MPRATFRPQLVGRRFVKKNARAIAVEQGGDGLGDVFSSASRSEVTESIRDTSQDESHLLSGNGGGRCGHAYARRCSGLRERLANAGGTTHARRRSHSSPVFSVDGSEGDVLGTVAKSEFAGPFTGFPQGINRDPCAGQSHVARRNSIARARQGAGTPPSRCELHLSRLCTQRPSSKPLRMIAPVPGAISETLSTWPGVAQSL